MKFSVKVRLGLEQSQEFLAVTSVFNCYPLEYVTIHPRLGVQMYDGKVDLDAFEACQELCEHRMIYNGDLFTADDFQCVGARLPRIKDWMFGCGVFSNPFLLEEIRGEQGELNRGERLKGFHDDLLADYSEMLMGDLQIIKRMMGHWEYLYALLPDGSTVCRKLRKCKTLRAFCADVTAALGEMSYYLFSRIKQELGSGLWESMIRPTFTFSVDQRRLVVHFPPCLIPPFESILM